MNTNGDGSARSVALDGYSRGSMHAGSTEIRYLRSGRGSPVLVLGEPGPLQSRLCTALESHFQIVVPAVDSAGTAGSIGELLRQLVDGLGLAMPHLVVDAGYGSAALGFVLGDTDRVDRLAILCPDPSATAAGGVALADTLRDTGHALMVMNLDAGEDTRTDASLQLDALVAFLGGGSGETSR